MRRWYGIVLLASVPAGAQAPQVLLLGVPNARAGSTHSRIGFVAETAGGLVFLTDSQEKQVFLVDLAARTEKRIGRSGSGPGEYRTPGRLVPLPGDSVLLIDLALRRATVLRPDGTMGDILVSAERRSGVPTAMLQAEAADGVGRLYARGAAMTTRGDQPVPSDSAALLRLERRSGRVDSLGWVRIPKSEIRISRSGSGSDATITAVQVLRVPLAPYDRWVVRPDGTVIVARDDGYRVDRIDPAGKSTRGSPLPTKPVLVSAADREEFPYWTGPWPAVKPAIEGSSPVLLAPNGDLWIRRSAPAADSAGHYDVVDLSSRLTATMTTPAGTRIVGFGRGGLYLVRTDADGLETLERYAIPAR